MTYQTHATPPLIGASIRNFGVTAGITVATFLETLNHALMVNSTGHLRLQQVERLQAKTDAELTALGIKRAEIVHQVFRHLY